MARLSNLALVVMVAFAGACASEAELASKAGGDDRSTVLQIGYAELQGTVGARHVETYVGLVEERSGGSLLLEPVWDAAGRGGPEGAVVDDWDQVAARKLIDGDLDLAVVPARAWDTEGVTTLRALNAPLLVTSDTDVERIVTSDVAEALLAGLDAVDVVGLALLPEDLRHLFLFGDPTLSELQGRIVRSPRSSTVYSFLRALGTSPDDVPVADEELLERVQRGDVAGAEGSFNGLLGDVSTAIGNVTLFPKIATIVANADTFEALSDEHRSVLRSAADELVEVALARHVTDDVAARAFCRDGGTVVDASPTEVAAIERAAATVHAELRREPSTAALLDRLTAIAGGPTTVEGVAPCAPPGSEEPVATVADDSGEFPDGVYRMEMPLQVLLDAGVAEAIARNHVGLWTLHLEDGRLIDPTCPGSTYSVADGRLTIELGDEGASCGSAAGKVLFSATWTVDGDELRFADVRSGHGNDLLIETLFGTLPFTRIR